MVDDLFMSRYTRIDRYLVFKYVRGRTAHSEEPELWEQILAEIPSFLEELSTVHTDRSLDDDFETLCENIDLAGIFQTRTMELIRRYYAEAQSMHIISGLEYYDAMPRNFAFTREGKLFSIDEKHLRIGPQGVSLIKPMGQLSKADFSNLKEAYLAKLDWVPFDDPEYRWFLHFYRHMTVLGATASYRPRDINMYDPGFHASRRVILEIIGASTAARLRGEGQWLRYRRHQVTSVFQRAPGFLKRRLLAAIARVGKKA